ncbi:MAG: hypothetical protein HYZ27_11415, partial [Deltaproteobacteria bacterium]|nr:hypothetical protein [Deltaproteobacteria bacterium]
MRLLGAGLLFALSACEEPLPLATVEVDALLTLRDVMGGEPVVFGNAEGCSPDPLAVALGNGRELVPASTVTLFPTDEGPDLFQMVIPKAALDPAVFGLPARFELVLELRCHERWVSSPPFAMTYVPTTASLAPPYNAARFWPGDT